MATEIIFKKLYFYAIACVYTSENIIETTPKCAHCVKKTIRFAVYVSEHVQQPENGVPSFTLLF